MRLNWSFTVFLFFFFTITTEHWWSITEGCVTVNCTVPYLLKCTGMERTLHSDATVCTVHYSVQIDPLYSGETSGYPCTLFSETPLDTGASMGTVHHCPVEHHRTLSSEHCMLLFTVQWSIPAHCPLLCSVQ